MASVGWDGGEVPQLATSHRKIVGPIGAVVWLGLDGWHWQVCEKRNGSRWWRILECGREDECDRAKAAADEAAVPHLARHLEAAVGSKS